MSNLTKNIYTTIDQYLELIYEKASLEGALAEINRAVGYYTDRILYDERKKTVELRLEEIKSILSGKPMPITATEGIQQFLITRAQ